jgi:hypothetical protein
MRPSPSVKNTSQKASSDLKSIVLHLPFASTPR